jgi:hypothetical protein
MPQSYSDVFDLPARSGWLELRLLPSMKSRVGFRNIAVHEYHPLQLPIMVFIIEPIRVISLRSAQPCCGIRQRKAVLAGRLFRF